MRSESVFLPRLHPQGLVLSAILRSRSCCSPEMGRGALRACVVQGKHKTSGSPFQEQPGGYNCLLQGLVSTRQLPAEPRGNARHPPPRVRRGREGTDPPSVLADKGRRLEGQTADLVFPELVLAVLQGVVHLISAWHLHVFSQLSLLRQKCENLKGKEL